MEYSLFDKIIFRMAKIGLIGLNIPSEKLRDDEEYVKICLNSHGAEEFRYASARLKSDANFVLGMVKKFPGVLDFCSTEMFDRYEIDGEYFQYKVELLDFISLCWCVNNNSVLYFEEEKIKEYYKTIRNLNVLNCKFQGKKLQINTRLIYDDMEWISQMFPQTFAV